MSLIRVELPTLRIITMPSSDEEFADRVASAARQVVGIHDERKAIAELETHLRGRYPTLRVSQQSGLASFDGLPLTWYFYRDG